MPTGSRTRASRRRSAAVATHDNALAESIIGLFKTEAIRPKGPWRRLEAVEFATLDRVTLSSHPPNAIDRLVHRIHRGGI